MSNIIYLGLDPGKQGFISAQRIEEDPKFYEMPYHKVETGELLKSGKPQTKSEFNIKGLVDLVYQIKEDFSTGKFIVGIEEVGGRGGWSATNNFNFGYVAGLQRMIFEMLRAEIVMIRPQKWQSYMRQGYPDLKKSSSTGKTQIRDPKAVAQLIVETEFPDIDFRRTTRSKKNDDNKIDSFLILQYLIRTSKK